MTERDPWWESAACRGDGHDRYFQLHTPEWQTTQVLRKCMEVCTVQAECLEHALRQPEIYGAWAGFTAQELFAIRTRRYSRCRVCKRRWPKGKLTPETTCRWCLIEQHDKERHDNDSRRGSGTGRDRPGIDR